MAHGNIQEKRTTEINFNNFFSGFCLFFVFVYHNLVYSFSSISVVWSWGWGVVLWGNWGSTVGNWLWLFNQLWEGGDGSGDFLWDWGWGWQMGTRWVVTGLVSVPLEGDWGSFWGGVGRGSLGSNSFTVLDSWVLQFTLLLNLDSVAGFESEAVGLVGSSWWAVIVSDDGDEFVLGGGISLWGVLGSTSD
uniref:Uncharacterized protein n=1 Tax=Cacopsylla melanoneura TaxID=428564 RepID=A0A8D8RAB8_9HEMI